jgi:hypothetical protein
MYVWVFFVFVFPVEADALERADPPYKESCHRYIHSTAKAGNWQVWICEAVSQKEEEKAYINHCILKG